jgi:hypothetical protein
MEDVIGIAAIDKKMGHGALMTWGRIFDPVDDKGILEITRVVLPKYGFLNVRKVAICSSLKEVASFPYFFEALLSFSWKPIPFGERSYATWRKRIETEMRAGKHFHFLGILRKGQIFPNPGP